jgi:hypothetical protein
MDSPECARSILLCEIHAPFPESWIAIIQYLVCYLLCPRTSPAISMPRPRMKRSAPIQMSSGAKNISIPPNIINEIDKIRLVRTRRVIAHSLFTQPTAFCKQIQQIPLKQISGYPYTDNITIDPGHENAGEGAPGARIYLRPDGIWLNRRVFMRMLTLPFFQAQRPLNQRPSNQQGKEVAL